MFRPRAFALSIAISLFACADADIRRIPTGEAASLFLAWIEHGEATRAASVSVDDDDRPFITVPALAPGEVLYVLDYPCALAGLGLVEGTVALAGEDEGYLLPTATRTRVLHPDRAELEDAGDLPAAITKLRYRGEPEETQCTRFEVSTNLVTDSSANAARVILPWRGDELLIATDAGLVYRLDTSDKMVPMFEWSAIPTLGGARTAMGVYTFAGYDARVVQRAIGGEPRTLPPFPGLPASIRAWVDTAELDESDEVFVLTDQRSFAHHRGGAWVFSETSSVSTATITEGGVARIGPGEAFVVGLGEQGLAHYRDGAWVSISTPIRTPIAEGDRFVSIVRAPGGGVVLGTSLGSLHRFDGSRWSTLTDQPLELALQVLTPIGDGFVAGGPEGVLFELHAGSAPCPKIQVSGVRYLDMRNADLERLVTAEHDLFAEYRGADFAREVSQIVRLTPREKVRMPRCF